MKKIFLPVVAAMFALAACAGGSEPSPNVERIGNVALVYATSKILNTSEDRASKANRIAQEAIVVLETGNVNSLDVLETFVIERLDIDALPPEDAWAAREVISIITEEMKLRAPVVDGVHIIGEGPARDHLLNILRAIVSVTTPFTTQ